MPLSGLRTLALGDLDEEALRGLVQSGEHLLIERKQSIPETSKLGAAVASFANAIGGWVLLGVTDEGDVVGYEPDDRLDLQSHLGNLLSAQVDPLPPFVADMRELDGKPVGVIRVFPSADTPHLIKSSGAIYVRDSKGKQPIQDASLLIALARRGEDARREASARLRSLTILSEALTPESWSGFRGDLRAGERPPADHLTVIVRAGPLTVTPQFSDGRSARTARESPRRRYVG